MTIRANFPWIGRVARGKGRTISLPHVEILRKGAATTQLIEAPRLAVTLFEIGANCTLRVARITNARERAIDDLKS